ncbi:MAG: putative transcriptional regulatory protein [Burkholderiales bacterium]|nr:putative transcriptional regulatory protein [Burkholderiales bacterium]
MPHLLLVDDDPEALEWLSELAKGEGFSVAQADSLRAARIHMSRLQPDVLLTDLQLPDGQGIELVNDLESRESTEVVLITGHASVESAVQALRLGATDYMVKPVDVDRLRAILRRVPRTGELRAEIGELREELRRLGRFGHLLGSSPPMQKLYDQLGRVAPTSHEKGSFTGADRQHKGYFERANGGTLFLDEITEMPQELQVKLLRVLETGAFMRVGTTTPISTDLRVICATNRVPEQAVADGKLREDLYHRLNVFPIAMPPLRERGTDIELLAQHFLDQLNKQESALKSFAPATIAALYAHTWPGNVRELKNYCQRAFILADEVIDANLAPAAVAAPESAPLLSVRVGTTLDEASRRLIEATLAECGSKRKAADMLGISLKTLYNRLAVYKSEAGKDRREAEDYEERSRV